MNRAALLACTGVAAVLVATLIVEYQATRPEDDNLPLVPNRSTSAIPARINAISGTDMHEEVDTILARPVFAASRRPPPRGSASVSGPTALPRLTAVLVSGRGKTVIFAGGPNGKPVSLGEGGSIGAYVVQSIGVGQATIAGPDGVHVLRPMFDGTAAGATPNSPVAARPSILDLLRQSTPALGGLGLPRPTTPGPEAAPR